MPLIKIGQIIAGSVGLIALLLTVYIAIVMLAAVMGAI